MTTSDLDIFPTSRVEWFHDVAGNAIASFDVTTDTLLIRSHAIAVLTAPEWSVFPISAGAASYPFLYSAED